MSGYGKNGRTTAGKVVMDWYKILQISPSSTSNEIKAAYYKIAQTAHPDKHNGCSKKLEQFKRINEAYDILSNPTKRNEYDVQMGHHHRHHSGRAAQPRRHNIPKDYRKVYTSRPPPEWKMVWDHTKHYEMHYGDGFQKEAMKQAIKTAEQDGSFIYHSSLGKGFTFHHLHDRSTTASSTTMNGATNTNRHHGATTNSSNYNPYSKNQAQGPQKIILDYQEITQNYGGDGSSTSSRSKRQGILKHERIVYDLHLRRYERYRDEVWNESQQDQPQRQSTTTAQHHNGGAATNDSQTSTTATTRTRSPIYSRFDWKYQQEQQQRQHKESLLSSFNFFSSFLTTAPTNLNGHDNNNNNNNSTNATPSDSNGTPNEHDTSEDRPTTNPHNKQQQQHNGMTESTAKNSSCTIM